MTEIIPDVDTIERLKITRFYDGHRLYYAIGQDQIEHELKLTSRDFRALEEEFRRKALATKEKLEAHGTRLPTFAPHLPQAQAIVDQFIGANFQETDQLDNLVKTFASGLTNVPGQDEAVQEDVAEAIRETQQVYAQILDRISKDRATLLEELLPSFVFHSATSDKIPNEVNISDFVKTPFAVSKGMTNLCGIAGLSMQKIQELSASTDIQRREVFEDHYRASVSGGINEFWTQETYTVHFRFESGKMSVSISDGTYTQRIAPLDRSDGFQWYLSFYAALINEVSQVRPTVFLLDNPGLELHPDGQRDIKRFLEEKLPANAQVVYVTHSPAMIDPFNLEQVRQVELKGNMQGTKIGRLAFKEGGDFDLLEPVRSAIGASLASSLIYNEFNVLVEGAADKPILEGALHRVTELTREKILVNGSVSETKDGFLVRFYQRANLPFVVYLDADSGGRDLEKSLKNWGVPDDKIVKLNEAVKDTIEAGKDFEIEDILSAEFYHTAVQDAYPDITLADEKATSNAGKRTKHYEEIFKDRHKIGFSKRRVAEKIKSLLLTGKADRETTDNLKRLTDAIVNRLKGQVGKRPEDRSAI